MESREIPSTPERTSPRRTYRIGVVSGAIIVLGLTAAVFWRMGFASYLAHRAEYARRTETFSGSSGRLKQTVIVPTLDSPCPPGKNVIWCSSFQLAWNEVRDKVTGAPLEVPEAAELAARLNAARRSASDIDPRSVYVAGGRTKDGIIRKIEKDMAARFPSHGPPDFSGRPHPPGGILAYSCLTARVPFKFPFRQVDEGLAFTDSQGIKTQVAGFGLWRAYLQRYKNLRDQVEVLYTQRDEDHFEELTECALDPCRHSTPYQVAVARVQPKGSLADTLEYVRTRISDFKKQPYYQEERRLGGNDELRIPEMFWKIDHRFEELIGKIVANANPPMPVIEALQTIEFRLDRSGAVLESEAVLVITAAPRYFVFDRPFLVYMQKRGAEHPFFVMWVDNAELLVAR